MTMQEVFFSLVSITGIIDFYFGKSWIHCFATINLRVQLAAHCLSNYQLSYLGCIEFDYASSYHFPSFFIHNYFLPGHIDLYNTLYMLCGIKQKQKKTQKTSIPQILNVKWIVTQISSCKENVEFFPPSVTINLPLWGKPNSGVFSNPPEYIFTVHLTASFFLSCLISP